MKSGLLFVIGLIGIFSCTPSRNKEVLRLHGDWIYIEDTTKIVVNYVGLRFIDDTLYTIRNNGYWQEGKYSVRGDTIYVEEFGGKSTTYEILRFTTDSLVLSHFGYRDKYYNRRLEYNPDLKFHKIKLDGGTCFGDCPQFTMTVERNGQVYFKGIKNGKFIGDKKYSIEPRQIDKIDSLFKWTCISQIDTADFYGAVDDWSISITFYYDADQVTAIRGTRGSMPYRIKGIIGTVLEDLRKRDLI